jgi:BirA family biotin operon repressor/biotin-[acetyl-CoA-carboxylase] ligase
MRYKRTLPNLRQLVFMLNDLNFHSGTELAKDIGVSRNAIWKMIRHLSKNGILIEKDRSKGYCLVEPLYLLEQRDILKLLPKALAEKVDVQIYSNLPSTNTYFIDNKKETFINPTFCLAEQQSAGKGRLGRVWHSPYGRNIYLSCRWQLPCDVSKLSGLSLVVGIAVVHALEKILPKESFQLKWPNDVWHEGKKLGGILIEMLAEAHSNATVIIVIGLNVNMWQDDEKIDSPWRSLADITQKVLDRNKIVSELVHQLTLALDSFMQEGCLNLKTEWQKYDALWQKNITVNNVGSILEGLAHGIDETGALMLKQPDSTMICCHVGDATLHGLN